MWMRSELKEHAKRVLKLNYWWVIAALVIFMFVREGAGSVSFFSVSLYNEDVLDSYLKESMMLRAFFVTAASTVTLLNTAVSAGLWCLVVNPLMVGIQRFLVKSCRGGGNSWRDYVRFFRVLQKYS